MDSEIRNISDDCENDSTVWRAQFTCSMRANSPCLANVKQNICNFVHFKVILTCILYQICVNLRLLGMRVQKKRLYAFVACIYNENIHTCPTRTRNYETKRLNAL